MSARVLLAALLGSAALGGCKDAPPRPRDEARDAPNCDEEVSRVSSQVRAASSADCAHALEVCRLEVELGEERNRPRHEPPRLAGIDCVGYVSVADRCLPKLPDELRDALQPMVDAQKRAMKSGGSANQRKIAGLLDPSCRALKAALEALPECAPPPAPPCKCENPADPLCPCP